jgi:hypothetical protein
MAFGGTEKRGPGQHRQGPLGLLAPPDLVEQLGEGLLVADSQRVRAVLPHLQVQQLDEGGR